MSDKNYYISDETEGYVGQEKLTNDNSEHWQEIYGAYQNKKILQKQVVAIEEHRTPEGDTPCLIIRWDNGVKGIIPAQATGISGDTALIIKNKMRKLVGKNIVFRIIEVDRENGLCLLSRKDAIDQMTAKTWKTIQEGDKKTVVVRETKPYGVKVNVGGIEATISASELSHGWINDVRDVFKVGDRFDVVVKKADKEEKKLVLSLKALLEDPWERVGERYSVDGEYLGKITTIAEFGVFINLETGIDMLVAMPQSETTRGLLEKGAEALARITSVDLNKRKIYGRLVRVNR
jgi:ribosomal protein S1